MENSSKRCPSCKSIHFENDEKCEICDYPLQGPEDEKALFMDRKYSRMKKAFENEKTFKRNQYILYFLGVINIIVCTFQYLTDKMEFFDLIFNLFLGVSYLGLGFFSRIQPLLAFIIALLLLLGVYCINYLADPESVIDGIIFKIIILGSLIYGIIVAAEKK